tara:strand:+ start:1552 stop:1818 length:267 start_codon:yes stop_codon:yes gene_type:complete
MEKTFGSRAEVWHSTALKTKGGLTKKDLVQDKYGKLVSKRARKAAVTRMEREGEQALVKVFKPPKKGGFKLQPKEGTKLYKRRIKKML